MAYKSILVHAALGPAAEHRVRLAASLARAFDAHLTGCAPTGVSRYVAPCAGAPGATPFGQACAALRRDAAEALARFAQLAQQEGAPRIEQRLIEDDASGMALHARYADLVVVGQPALRLPTRGSPAELPAQLLRECPRPLLVAPPSGRTDALGAAILLAWDGSVAATRAVAAALPLMRAAGRATILHLGDAPCTELADYLARHGVAAGMCRRPAARDAGSALLHAAAEMDASLLVMGAYSRPPLNEALLGGATADVLQDAPLPVLLAH